MSLCDPYREFELYLEQVENEITQVFENGALDFGKKEIVPSDATLNQQEWELDPFLLEVNDTIQSDLTELLARYKLKDFDELPDGSDILLDSFYSDSLAGPNPINVATQTSPSLSPSSTNLTWASECSSSPCLTSTSDSDLIDDDAHSISSNADRRETILASWNGTDRWKQVLGSKSSSAPILEKIPIKVNKQTRSQSDQHLAEIEAAEACKWLRATGFPQYAQMFEDALFPVDISTAVQDHPLLEPDVLNSLFRRLQILNSCAHLHQQRVAHTTDESEDEFCAALSDNWTYQTDIRRWSRTCKNPQLGEDNGKTGPIFDEVACKSSESPKERLRRSGSTKFRRRPKGVIGDSGSKLLDTLSQQLNEFKTNELNHVSDSECTPKQRRARTKSFDKSDAWFQPPAPDDRVLWQKLPQEEGALEKARSSDALGPAFSNLSCTQLQVLRKLALLKLTAHMEKYCPSHRTGWNWDLPKFIRKIKTPAYKDKRIFGVPLTTTLQRTGQPLPKSIEEALLWLQQNATNQVGLFRKPGVKSRIQALRNSVETNQDIHNFTDQQCYDIADMVKQYFRDLPEALLTNKLSETFILIFQYVPPFLRQESVTSALLLMPDEHVQVLQALLNFLETIARHSNVNQMNENNLATCFAPSLFHYSQISSGKHNLGTPHPKELAETKAAHECLLYFLTHNNKLFHVPKEFVNQCKSNEFKETKVVTLSELGREMGGWREFLNESQLSLLKESKEKGRGWMVVSSLYPKIELAYRKVADGHPLKFWRISAEIEAPPTEVMHRILRERHIWDLDLKSAKIVSQLGKNCEVFQYVRKDIMSLPNQEYCVLRTWSNDLPKDACFIIETSIEHPDATPAPNTVRGVVLVSRYLIEPCGSGKSRLLHYSRIDIMGRTLEWYQKNYGHICALFISNIQNSFTKTAIGPESKV